MNQATKPADVILPGAEIGCGSHSVLRLSSGESISGAHPISARQWGTSEVSTRRSARRRAAMGHQSQSRKGDGEVSRTRPTPVRRDIARNR